MRMIRNILLFLLIVNSAFAQNLWKVISNRLVPISPAYGIDLRSGIYGTSGFRLGYSTQTDSGTLRYNAQIIQYYNGAAWLTIATTSSGSSVGNADSLGGLPASSYLLKADSAKIAANTPLSVAYTNHTATVSGDTLTRNLSFATDNDRIRDSLQAVAAFVPMARTVTAGTFMTGGGALSGNITLNFDSANFHLPSYVWRDPQWFQSRLYGTSAALDTIAGKTSTKIVFPDSAFFGIQSTLNNELVNISSNTDADLKLWTASTADLSSVNMYRSRGTITSPSNISASDVVGQVRGFGYKDGFKELANITFTSQTDTTAQINFWTRDSAGLSSKWTINNNGDLIPTTTNIFNVGQSGFRPDSVYARYGNFFTDVVVGNSDPGATVYGEKLRVNDAILSLHTNNVLSVSNTLAPVIHLMRALAGTTAVTANTSLGSIGAQGYDGTDYGGRLESGLISFVSVSNFTTSSHKTRIMFATADTLQPRNWWQIESTGELLPSYGDNTGSIGNATNRIRNIYGMNGTWGGRLTSTDIVATDSVSGVTGNFTSTLTAGSTGSATVALMQGSGVFSLAIYRGTNSVSSASGIRFDAQNSASAQTPYATIFGQIMLNTASIQSGALGIQTYKNGSAVRAALIDSIQNLFLGIQSTPPLTDTRLLIRSNVTGLYALSVIPSNSTTKVVYDDTTGNRYAANKMIADSSFTINERSTTPTLPTSNTQMHMYMKGDKIIWVINAAGTPRYYYFDATATANQQIIYSATAP